MQERKSPADICINKRSTWIDFDPTKDVLQYGEGHHQIQVTIEHRAWVCPFCEQSTEYWLANGSVILGCGMSSLISNLKRSDCCDRWECRRKQEEWHKTPAAFQ